jgi:phosphate starvation-inducible membrane PsiE
MKPFSIAHVQEAISVVLSSDRAARCYWLSNAYTYSLTLFTAITALMIVSKKSNTHIVWAVIAVIMVILTLVFYTYCHQSLPRATALP